MFLHSGDVPLVPEWSSAIRVEVLNYDTYILQTAREPDIKLCGSKLLPILSF
jgi:hypothetical protein